MENKQVSVVDNKSVIVDYNRELNEQTNDPAVMKALLATTFKGFKNEVLVKQACLEAMINGYTFQDIIQKKVYAIPYGQGYSLVQSIASVRATAMKSGQIGKDAPIFEEDENGKVLSCSVTVKRMSGGQIGDYTAKVYFKEYDKGRDNWKNKPRTMISKVAEMHALRMAFPEELAQVYIEDEFNHNQKEMKERGLIEPKEIDIIEYSEKLNSAKDLKELQEIWDRFSASAKTNENLITEKDKIKEKFAKVDEIESVDIDK